MMFPSTNPLRNVSVARDAHRVHIPGAAVEALNNRSADVAVGVMFMNTNSARDTVFCQYGSFNISAAMSAAGVWLHDGHDAIAAAASSTSRGIPSGVMLAQVGAKAPVIKSSNTMRPSHAIPVAAVALSSPPREENAQE